MFNLHTLTAQGSFESIITINDLMQVDSPVVSITDPNMVSTIEFYEVCMENNKKPIIGLDAYVAFGKANMLLQKYNRIAGRLTLIAYNKEGYHNLVRLSTRSYMEGFYKYPRIDYFMLKECNEGLLCLINSEDSIMALHIQNKNSTEALKDLNILKSIFKDRIYSEYYYPDNSQSIMNFSFPIIGTIPAKYMNQEDFLLWQDFMAINRNVLLQDFMMEGYKNIFAYNQEIEVGQLWNLVDRIEDYELGKSEARFPKMKTTKASFGFMLIDKLEELGLGDKEHTERLEYEFKVINKFGYKDYFLMVKDIIDYCNRELSGYISAGRGSVGGCLVAYLLGITRIDPVNPVGFNIQIPFDRFLNSSRKVLPDIDLDFCPQDRQPIIDYLKKKYGEDSCKNIITVMTMGARGALRSICRVTNNLTSEIDAILKSFPSDQQLTLEMVKESDIYKKNKNNAIFVEMFQTAQNLEKLPKSYGVHASGLAISAQSMDGYIPIATYNNREVTQYQQDQLEYMGIVKFDILGLNTLQIIGDTLKLMGAESSIQANIEFLNQIPLDDLDVYEFINGGRITGVFQWDTHNYRMVIKDVKPSNFKELVDLNTLGRSAALLSGLTDKYVRRKNKQESIIPLHPKLANIMKETMELPLYQEQIMAIFTSLADYSQAEADDVRKAIGKKIPELMEKQKSIFAERCIKNGIDSRESDQIWKIIDKFSKYTWNLGHAITYTRICYETAYLAYHYPEEFYCACINNAKDSADAGRFIDALKKRKIKIGNVDINKSERQYTVQKGKIVPGFTGLKFLSDKTIDELIAIRGDGFKNWEDFDKRVPKKLINKTALLSLYITNTFKKFDAQLVEIADRLGMEIIEMTEQIYDQYNKCGQIIHDVRKDNHDRIQDLNSKGSVIVPAYVISIKEIYTRHGDKMAFVDIEDISGRYETTWFPQVWQSIKLIKGNLYEFKLRWDGSIIGIDAREYNNKEKK